MTASKPLPPMGEDPSIVKGQQVRAGYNAGLQAIRENRSLNELQVAEQVVAARENTNSQLSTLFVDLQKRRQARLDVLETLVPLGPAIPAGASAADTAVLHQAFRSGPLADESSLRSSRRGSLGNRLT